jgi:acyl dehydratase
MSNLRTGDVLFETELAPAGRDRVAEFSQGTQDPNPIHVDDAFAQLAGFPTVLQQGPMTTAQFARLLEQHLGEGKLKVLDVSFTAPVFPEDRLILRAEITDTSDVIRCALLAKKPDGTQTAKGFAEVAA